MELERKVADGTLDRFRKDKQQFVAVLEDRSARNPLDRPFAGRRMAALAPCCPERMAVLLLL